MVRCITTHIFLNLLSFFKFKSLGVWGNFIANNYSSELPGIDVRVLTVAANFKIPFWRDFLLSMGLVDASRGIVCFILVYLFILLNDIDTVSKILEAKDNLSVMVIAGGATESLDARPKTNLLTLNKRKGFVRLALQHGVPLVPVFSFGEYVYALLLRLQWFIFYLSIPHNIRNDLYDQLDNPDGSTLRKWQNKILSVFGMPRLLFLEFEQKKKKKNKQTNIDFIDL